MNTTSKTNSTTNTGSGAGSSIGNRVNLPRGAAQVIHGAGENLRGTMLGAVDTMGHKGMTRNDEIAREGRLEMERGMANMKGKPVQGQTSHGAADKANTYDSHTHTAIGADQPFGDGPHSAASYPGKDSLLHGGTSAEIGPDAQQPMQNYSSTGPSHATTGHDSLGIGNQHTLAGAHGPESTYPIHHRDDAITGVPQSELNEIQALGQQQHYGGQPNIGATHPGPHCNQERQGYDTSGRGFGGYDNGAMQDRQTYQKGPNVGDPEVMNTNPAGVTGRPMN